MSDICRCGRYKLHEGFAYPLVMSDGPTVPIIESTHRIGACLPGGTPNRPPDLKVSAEAAQSPQVGAAVASADPELAALLREARAYIQYHYKLLEGECLHDLLQRIDAALRESSAERGGEER